MKKNKYLQIFNYLKEFSKLRSNPVRDINDNENQYPEKLWLNDIPESELFENVVRHNFNLENEYWIKVSKPKEPIKPNFTELPNKLKIWIKPSSLLNEEGFPVLNKQIESNGEIFLIEDFPEINKEFIEYINQKWIDDLLDYNSKIEIYELAFKSYELLNNTYKKLFRIFNKTSYAT